MASGLFAEAMPDITVAGLNVRYKVYPEKKKKPKIKYCIGFDEDSPTPERDWDQFRSDKDPEAAVRDAVESATSADSASQLQGVSQPIGRRELASLDELNHAADGPALQPGWGAAEQQAQREREQAAWAERQQRQAEAAAASRQSREANEKARFEGLVMPIIEDHRRTLEFAKELHHTRVVEHEAANAGVSAAVAKMAALQDQPLSSRLEAAAQAAVTAMGTVREQHTSRPASTTADTQASAASAPSTALPAAKAPPHMPTKPPAPTVLSSAAVQPLSPAVATAAATAATTAAILISFTAVV